MCIDDAGGKLSDGIIETGMIESNMMEPVDGPDAIHFDRANGDDLGENQELLNDRCVKSANCSTTSLIYVLNISFDFVVTRWIVIVSHQRIARERCLQTYRQISKWQLIM